MGDISPGGGGSSPAAPVWISAISAAATFIYTAVRDHRQQQEIAWVELLQAELADLEPDELRRVAKDPAVAELVGRAWEAALRTASDGKRRLYARVVAAAMRGDAATPNIQPLAALERTLTNLEQEHIALLAIIASPDGKERKSGAALEGQVDGAVKREEIEERWQGAADLIDPAIAALEGARVVDRHLGYNGPTHSWTLNRYGRRFLDFVEVRDGD
jgi:hypothetical protein